MLPIFNSFIFCMMYLQVALPAAWINWMGSTCEDSTSWYCKNVPLIEVCDFVYNSCCGLTIFFLGGVSGYFYQHCCDIKLSRTVMVKDSLNNCFIHCLNFNPFPKNEAYLSLHLTLIDRLMMILKPKKCQHYYFEICRMLSGQYLLNSKLNVLITTCHKIIQTQNYLHCMPAICVWKQIYQPTLSNQ